MNENVIISTPQKLEETLKAIKADWKENFHVVADFDKTLTKAFVAWEKSSTVIAQIRNWNYLTPDYPEKAHALFDHYNAIEIDSNYLKDEKIAKMYERREKHYDLIIKSWLTKQIIQNIVSKKSLKFREWSELFFNILKENQIPLVIISASVGDMISAYLLQEWWLFDNIYVVSNLFEFDENWKVISVKKPIVHCMNKSEVILDQFNFFNKIKDRKNVLLLWDSPDDIDMIHWFDYKNLIKIWFCNHDENLEEFKNIYDVVILNDGDMDYINQLIVGLK